MLTTADVHALCDLYDRAHYFRRAFDTHEALQWGVERGLISLEEKDAYYLRLWAA